MTAHVQSEIAKERKIQRLEKQMEDKEKVPETTDTAADEVQPQGRRRAAVKWVLYSLCVCERVSDNFRACCTLNFINKNTLI